MSEPSASEERISGLTAPWIREAQILAFRPERVALDPQRPYAYFVEKERTATGTVEDVATVFLTNKECPFRCLMCDLWKHTISERTPVGAIPQQIEFALSRLPVARQIKLYNSGNFFDAQAIPHEDWPAIARLVGGFERVIVENHPRFVGPRCEEFQQLLGTELEVAMGLETVHPEVLPRLNKSMTLEEFSRATAWLVERRMPVRAFLLLRPPYLSEEEGLDWACHSLEFAFETGVECCSVIPVRGGNGILEQLQQQGWYSPPSLSSVEQVLEFGLGLHNGRVFVDLWDLERFDPCPQCGPFRRERLTRMNLSQEIEPRIRCECGGSP